jgi:hypothetical protein
MQSYYIQAFYVYSEATLHTTLTSPPLQLPSCVLKVICSKFALNDRPEVDVQYTRIAVCASALRPLQICGAAPHSDVIFDLWASTCQATCEHALNTISMYSITLMTVITHSISSVFTPEDLRIGVQAAVSLQIDIAHVVHLPNCYLPACARSRRLNMYGAVVCCVAFELCEGDAGAVAESCGI